MRVADWKFVLSLLCSRDISEVVVKKTKKKKKGLCLLLIVALLVLIYKAVCSCCVTIMSILYNPHVLSSRSW